MSIKSMIAFVPGKLGYEIRRKQPDLAESVLARKTLNTLIDVGANAGQFARSIRDAQPQTTIHSFEPIPAVFMALKKNFDADARFFSYNLAIGDRVFTSDFEVNESSPSSSLLPLDETHKQIYPSARKTTKISVQVTTLDLWAREHQLMRPIGLKLDVQGNELAALRGANELLPQIDYVLVEVSFSSMYQGQPSFEEIQKHLLTFDFRFVDFFSIKRSSRTYQCLFGDALFARS